MRRSVTNGRSEEEFLPDTLQKLREDDPGAAVHIMKDVTEPIHLNPNLRANFERYNVVLMFDHAYKINKNRMPIALWTAMGRASLSVSPFLPTKIRKMFRAQFRPSLRALVLKPFKV